LALVPTLDFHRSVKVVQTQPARRFQVVAVMEVGLVTIRGAKILQITTGQKQGRAESQSQSHSRLPEQCITNQEGPEFALSNRDSSRVAILVARNQPDYADGHPQQP